MILILFFYFRKESSSRKRAIGGGRKLTDADFYSALKSWITNLRSKKSRATRNMILFEAQRISQNYPSLEKFKVKYYFYSHCKNYII